MLRKDKSHGYTDEELFEIGYWSCAIFTAHDERFHSEYQWDDINPDDRAAMRDQLVSFCDSVRNIVPDPDWEQMGIDLCFYVNGCGVDFRDRDVLNTQQKTKLLDAACLFNSGCKEIYEDEETGQLRYG